MIDKKTPCWMYNGDSRFFLRSKVEPEAVALFRDTRIKDCENETRKFSISRSPVAHYNTRLLHLRREREREKEINSIFSKINLAEKRRKESKNS